MDHRTAAEQQEIAEKSGPVHGLENFQVFGKRPRTIEQSGGSVSVRAIYLTISIES
jgi:hypothetical protein